MRKQLGRTLLPALSLLPHLLLAQATPHQARIKIDTAAIEAKVKQASEYLSDPDQNEGGVRGLKLLAEAIALAAPETGFPAEFSEKISAAGRKLVPGAPSNQDGIALLGESYRIINSGKDYSVPSSISDVDHAKDFVRAQIEKSRSYLAQGKIAEFARTLLDVALMIVTPILN